VTVKYGSPGAGALGDWPSGITDPADLFVALYDALPETAARRRPDLDPALWRSMPTDNPIASRLGSLLDAWYLDPQVQRCAERVREFACQGSVPRHEVAAVAPASRAPAVFSVLLGLDRALHNAHPGQRGTAMAGLSKIGLRYIRTGRLSTGRVAGALLPRKSLSGEAGGSILACCFLSVERIPAETWDVVSHRRLPTYLDIGRRSESEELRLAAVPLLAREDLAVSVITAETGQPVAFRLVPRDTVHLRERMRSVLDALDRSGAVIAVLPDHALSVDLLAHWQALLRATRPPVSSSLKWILVGGGAVDSQAPSISRAILLDRDLGEIVLAQDKLVPSRLELRHLTLQGIDTQEAEPAGEAPAPVSDWIPEAIAAGAKLNILDSGLGRIAILSGDQPADLEPALRHVTHLLRAGLPSQPQFDQLADAPADASGLVLANGLLVSGLAPGDPLSGGVVYLPTGEAAERHNTEIIVTTAFQPDEVTITSLSSGGEDIRLSLHAGGYTSGSAARLRELQRIRLTDQAALLRDGTREVEDLISQFAAVSDSRQVAMGAYLVAQTNAACGRVTAAKEAIDRVITAARSGGAEFLEAEARAMTCYLRYWDDVPLDLVVIEVGTELEWARARGYPYLEATALGVLAQANSLLGLPTTAIALVERAVALGEEFLLGPDSAELAARDSTARASVLLTTRDLAAAASVLDRSDLGLRRIGAEQMRPPILALSARVRHHMGEPEAAHRLLDDCARRASPNDMAVQASHRGVRALLLANQGDYVVAEQLARSAVQASDWSERLDIQAQTRADLASVLVRSNRTAEAALPAAWALRLYERKRDVAGAVAIRELVAPAQGTGDWPFRTEAWVMADETTLVAGRTAEIGMRLLRQATVSADCGTGAGQLPEVIVTLMAGNAAIVRPNGQRLRLPDSGYTQTLVFQVTPHAAMPLRLQFLVNLYEEGTLLQEMGVTVPVESPQPGIHPDGR
jgi:hypothetical protein